MTMTSTFKKFRFDSFASEFASVDDVRTMMPTTQETTSTKSTTLSSPTSMSTNLDQTADNDSGIGEHSLPYLVA